MGFNNFVHFPILLIVLLGCCCFIANASLPNKQQQQDHFKLSSSTTFPKLQAERLIRQLNLFPKHPFNLRVEEDDGLSVEDESGLVEKRFEMSGLLSGDPGTTVEDLGHHAGYYRLPHSKDARCVFFFLWLF